METVGHIGMRMTIKPRFVNQYGNMEIVVGTSEAYPLSTDRSIEENE